MNKIESYVYKKVKNNYLLKNSLRNIYHRYWSVRGIISDFTI